MSSIYTMSYIGRQKNNLSPTILVLFSLLSHGESSILLYFENPTIERALLTIGRLEIQIEKCNRGPRYSKVKCLEILKLGNRRNS